MPNTGLKSIVPDNPDTYFARDARGAREELFAREARGEVFLAREENVLVFYDWQWQSSRAQS